MNKYNFERKTPPELNEDLAVKLRNIRKKRKLSQEELSRRSGVSLGTLKRFESSGQISLISFNKLVYALDLSEEIENLFENLPPQSIQELIR